MDIEKALYRLPKKSPPRRFVSMSKKNLISRIELCENESRLLALFKKFKPVTPPRDFVVQARVRLIEKIHEAQKPVWAWLTFAKRFAASTLIMAIAVTATLFFVEGQTTVSASQDTYVEVLAGRVTLKHADLLAWNEIDGRTDLTVGDLIKLDENAEAIVHFFDDTQLRLEDNALLLISRIDASPVYSRQGILEVSLHQGSAWVQTLNVDDGHAGFTMVTRDAIIKALNSSFDVSSRMQSPTNIRVFADKIDCAVLRADTRQQIESLKINKNQQLSITSSFKSSSLPAVTMEPIMQQDMANSWTQKNLEQDHLRLADIRKNELNRLYQVAGTLPGDMLYPVKQAKERLKLAFTFNKSETVDAQIKMANSRLNEAIVLLEKGDEEKAKEALAAYQDLSYQIAQTAKQEKEGKKVAKKLLAPAQKSLVASLPGPSPVDLVKQTLNETKELLAESPAELEQVRLENTIENLEDISMLAQMGNFNAVKEALKTHRISGKDLLNNAESLPEAEKEEAIKNLLDMRNEEMELILSIKENVSAQKLPDTQLAAIVDETARKTEEEMQRILAAAAPFMPSAPEATAPPAQLTALEKQVQAFADKVNIYKTWQGQKNQISRLLKADRAQANNMMFLTALQSRLEGRAADMINSKILELEAKAKINKHKSVRMKIDRAKGIRKE